MPQPKPPIFEFEAIGTRWWCEALTGDIDDSLRKATYKLCDAFNRAYSRFRDDSLIGQLNTHKQLAHPPRELLDMLALCRELYDVSDGAFNVSIGGVLHAQGYGNRKFGARSLSDFWDKADVNANRIQIPDDATIAIDGIGKGWLIDQIAVLFREHGVTEFIINGGGDMFIASPTPIPIALEDPSDPSNILRSVDVTGGFAASSQTKRTWQDSDTTRAHIIDPSTNSTAINNVRGVFVNAPTATIADACATILLVRPDLHETLSKRYGLKVLIV